MAKTSSFKKIPLVNKPIATAVVLLTEINLNVYTYASIKTEITAK